MTRVLLLVSFILLISLEGKGQCPTLSLSRVTGITCGTTPITVDGNIFGGTATRVTLSENGTGVLTPVTSLSSPFSFTYTPGAGDIGRTVVITVITDIGIFPFCVPASGTFTLSVEEMPAAPVAGSVTQPTCSVATGSVVLNGLPASGTWTLTRSPGNVITNGTGTSTTITGLSAGSYTYTVTSASGCLSPSSLPIVINSQQIPAVPTHTVDCTLGFGRAVVTVTSPIGSGYEYRLDAGSFQPTAFFTNVGEGNHTVSVRNSAGCVTTGSSFQIQCGCVNGPTLNLSSASGSTCGITAVTVTGNRFGGSATSATITENGAGSVNPGSVSSSPFSFTYTPAAGDIGNVVTITVLTNNPLGLPCTAATQTYALTVSSNSAEPQIGTVVQPTCGLSTGSVVLNGLPSSGTWTVTRLPGGVTTNGTGISTTISGLSAGSYTFTVSNASGCTSLASTSVTINSQSPSPSAPVIGTVTQPSCAVPTGSVVINGLPITGSWIIIRSPGAVNTTGSGPSTTISGLTQGTFTFTVTNSFGCVSPASGNVVISQQPNVPSPPVIGLITVPTCAVSTGTVSFSGLPTGSWTLTRNPGGVISTGQGAGTTLTGVPGGTYTYTVTNSAGCVSAASADVVVPAQPATPAAPLISLITQPRFDSPFGTVALNGLPGGNWTLTLRPGNVVTTGTGTSRTVTGIAPGVYNFTVTNAAGCTSQPSASFEINIVTGPPVVLITNPAPVCFPSTVDITIPAVTTGSTLNLIYTYWTDEAATRPYNTPGASPAGTYYIKGTTSDGFFTVKPVVVSVYRIPVANAGPDQNLPNVFNTRLNAVLGFEYESGIWRLTSGAGNLVDSTNAQTDVTGLSIGRNKFRWTVTNKVCEPSSDSVFINIGEIAVPTLITPNMDGKNDYLILKKGTSDQFDLIIFDRKGAQVYKNSNYDNSWNGVDYNGKELPDDTYFYIVKSQSGASVSGYIVIRR